MVTRLTVVWAMVLACVVALPDYSENLAEAAAACEMSVIPQAPKAPTGVKIIGQLLEPLFQGMSVYARAVTNAYYDTLVGRAECLTAYSLRSQEQIDALPTLNKDSDKKLPLLYDSVQDAAKISLYPPESTDIQGKMLPMTVSTGSVLLTWDYKFDENFKWLGEGYMARHKTWRLDPGPWLAMRTDYRHASQVGQFGELFITLPGGKFAVEGLSWRQHDYPNHPDNFNGWFGEMLQPAKGVMYYDPNTWVRVWIYVENMGKAIWNVSIWAADETRDPVMMYDSVPLYPPDAGAISDFRIGFDTSADTAIYPTKMIYGWNRNVVVLKDVARPTVLGMLKRPGA